MGYVSEDRNLSERRAFANKQNALLSTSGGPVENNVCRYYQAGYCRRGSSCHFAHSSKSEQASVIASLPYHPNEGDACFPYNQTAVYHPAHSQALSPFLWQPYPPLLSHFGHPQPPDIYPDYPDDTSDPSSSEASSTTTHFDYDVRRPHPHVYSSSFIRGSIPPHCSHAVAQASEYTDYSGNIKPEGFPSRGAPASLGHHAVNRFAIVYPRAFFLPWQDDPKRKPLAYKTKPCRFYAANGKCTSGDKCTFIHDLESETDKLLPAQQLGAHLPPKPVSKYEEFKARDFYPISWRVIGGGVMMGGERKFCRAFAAGYCEYGNDCKLAHETEVEADPLADGIVELKVGSILTGNISRCATPKNQTRDKITRRVRSRRRRSLKLSSPEPDLFEGVFHLRNLESKNKRAVAASENSSDPDQTIDRRQVDTIKSEVSTSVCRRRAKSTPTSPLVSHMAMSTFPAEL